MKITIELDTTNEPDWYTYENFMNANKLSSILERFERELRLWGKHEDIPPSLETIVKTYYEIKTEEELLTF
jgi:hypothetical protein